MHVVAASPRGEPPPLAPTSSEDVAAFVVTTDVFASTSTSATLSALFTLAPARFSAIGRSMFRNGGSALRHHASSEGRGGSRSRSLGGGGGEGGAGGVAYPPTWSLPLTLSVELLAGFLSEVLGRDELDGWRRGDAGTLASLGAYVRAIRGAMAFGVPPLP